jgi:hypothetical protein
MTLNRFLKLIVFSGSSATLWLSIGIAQSITPSGRALLRHTGDAPASSLMRGPVLGLLESQDNLAVQEIVGVPGAALVGSPIPLPANTGTIYLAPGHRWALAVKADGSGIGLLSLGGESPLLTDVPSAIPSPTLVSFSPTGKQAAIYSVQENRLQIVNSNSSGGVGQSIDLPSYLSGAVRAIGIDDGGQFPVIVTSSDSTYVVSGSSVKDIFVRGSAVADFTFLPNSTSLFIVDTDGTVSAVDSLTAVPSFRTITSLGTPGDHFLVRGLGVTQSLLVASVEAKTAWRLNVNTALSELIALPETPALLDRLRNGDSFLFSDAPDGPAWLLVADEPTMRAVFAARPGGRPSRQPVLPVNQ